MQFKLLFNYPWSVMMTVTKNISNFQQNSCSVVGAILVQTILPLKMNALYENNISVHVMVIKKVWQI